MNHWQKSCVVVLGGVLGSGCNGSDAQKKTAAEALTAVTQSGSQAATDSASKAAAREMANMPGMVGMPGMHDTAEAKTEAGKTNALPSKLSLTAAQIAHGGVQWKPATASSTAASLQIPGTLIPNEDRTVRYSAPARARILKVLVRPGDRVSTGQVLVTLQSAEAGMVQADVSKATAEITARRSEAQYAASARARAERLLALKAIPRQDYERAIADDERARAALSQAESEARRARTTANQLDAGANANGEIVLRASSVGVVLSRSATPGSVIEAGSPLVVITDLSSLWLSMNAPETMIASFRRGARVRFTVAAYPGDTLVANIETVGAGLDEQTRTLNVRALVNNTGNRLKYEMLADVIVSSSGNSQAISVPEDAVQIMQGKPNVFVASTDRKGGAQFTRREVVAGARSNGVITIVRGLNAGEMIVTAGAFAVKAEFQKANMPKMEM